MRLRIEAALIYVAAPVVMAVFVPPSQMFPMLFALTAVGLVLLHYTPGFRWRALWQRNRIGGRYVALCTLATALVCGAVMALWHPDAAFALPRERSRLWVMILLLYPLISALPQELIYRALYFRRYASILPRRGALMLNAALFSLAHLMYWSPLVALMTFCGGLAFAISYRRHHSFAEAWLLHAIAGNILFTFGLGIYFYSGNVTRPF